jgi:hypothetical protein
MGWNAYVVQPQMLPLIKLMPIGQHMPLARVYQNNACLGLQLALSAGMHGFAFVKDDLLERTGIHTGIPKRISTYPTRNPCKPILPMTDHTNPS